MGPGVWFARVKLTKMAVVRLLVIVTGAGASLSRGLHTRSAIARRRASAIGESRPVLVFLNRGAAPPPSPQTSVSSGPNSGCARSFAALGPDGTSIRRPVMSSRALRHTLAIVLPRCGATRTRRRQPSRFASDRSRDWPRGVSDGWWLIDQCGQGRYGNGDGKSVKSRARRRASDLHDAGRFPRDRRPT